MKSFLIILSCLSICFYAEAQETLPKNIQNARAYRAELVNRQDELLELLLQVPFDMRQYIFPMLSSEQTIPKKIRTHPEIAVWKGKIPTRIADRFKNDPEFIKYLPEQFYYFLAPEMWPTQENKTSEMNPNQILQNMMLQSRDSSNILPEELVDVYTGLSILQQWPDLEKNATYPLYFKNLAPKLPKEIKEKIIHKTRYSADDFGKKLDNIAKSYRLYQKQKIPPASDEQKLVQKYWSLIPFIFQKTNFSKALNTDIYTD